MIHSVRREALPSLDMLKKFDKSFALTGKNYGSRGRTPNRIRGTSCLLPECGSRICSTTTSAVRKCASFLMERRKAKFPSARTTPESGWRNILEKMHQNATVAQWYRKYGKHTVLCQQQGSTNGNRRSIISTSMTDHAARVRVKGDGPQNAHDEEIMRRKLLQQQMLGSKVYQIKPKTEPPAGVAGD